MIFPIAGPFQIRWYGLMFLFVFWWGYLLLRWQFRRQNRQDKLASEFVNWGVAGILIGAWFAHRFFYEWDRVLENPLYLIDLRQGLSGLSSHGATLGLMAALIAFAVKRSLPVGWMVDSCTFGAAMSGILVRLGNLFNSEIVGRPAEVAWCVCLPRYECARYGAGECLRFKASELVQSFPAPIEPRHPTQLYEAGAGLLLLLILLAVDRMDGGRTRRRWLLTGTYLVVYFAIRYGIEGFKQHQTGIHEGLTMGQWLSMPMFVMGLCFLGYSLTRGIRETPMPDTPPEIENTA